MNRVKKNKKKGFTLVELMIVVVIMVILAAAASPIFKGYLDRAKEASHLADCRTVYVAAQTVAQDWMAADHVVSGVITIAAPDGTGTAQSENTAWNDVEFAANVVYLSKVNANTGTFKITFTGGEVTEIEYTDTADNTTVKFTP